ncbi:hypothetical protein MMMDOFMJ_0164 [Methylobacterium gnaphalii]|uniref:Uncharacterized protein n=1 Tax=Methylobacterium gnaphalii TaxID=1010610 RepID=A0A512JIP5_9HYPH|nr:hypothetical protein MGN01_16800 [Methylobacterium gnaphalii]GJD67250.1 hypothetical protein MMMDOFMJ_0164 [Methylobacterium gnaphalii]GLS49864.1 hypothetical protein GCM10007885_27160 [Methylobacterium gnaphalii]
MTPGQRSALLSMLDAIRACSCCLPDIRERADALEMKLSPLHALYRKLGLA